MKMRIGEGTVKVKALVDMYLICASAALTAKESEDFWRSKYNEEEAAKSNYLYSSYMEKAIDARERLLSNYAELLGTGLLKDILSDGASSEDFCLDEYQIALIRAKAVLMYWERKSEIAEAVSAYANELSSGRMTDAEGLRAWEEAKNAYNKSLAAYETELEKLNKNGENIREQQLVLDKLTKEMTEEEEKLAQLKSEYLMLLSVSAANMENFYYGEINKKYDNLADIYKSILKTGEEAGYWDTLVNGMLWGIAELNEISMSVLNYLNSDNDLSESERAEYEQFFESLSISSLKETWNESLDALALLFGSYGVSVTRNTLPDIEVIGGKILSKNGDFLQNTIQFIREFDNCFSSLPEWIQYEIENWKNAFINFVTVNAFCSGYITEKSSVKLHNEYEVLQAKFAELYLYAVSGEIFDEEEADKLNAEIREVNSNIISISYAIQIANIWEKYNNDFKTNTKHWREYLLDSHIETKQPSLEAASDWRDGIYKDSLISAKYHSNRINDAFNLISKIDLYAAAESSDRYLELFDRGVTNNYYFFMALESHQNEIANIIKIYELTEKNYDELMAKKDEINAAIIFQEGKYEAARSKYLIEADKFLKAGLLYDEQYKTSKRAHENNEQKRFEYEKQDAIQRWAATAYLNTEYIDTENSKNKLLKAQTVLSVLSDLYKKEDNRSNGNAEYNALYTAYEESFNRKIKIMEAAEVLSASIIQEKQNNAALFENFVNSLAGMGYIDKNFDSYYLPENMNEWNLMRFVTVKNGKLAFSYDENSEFTGIDGDIISLMNNYFNNITEIDSSGNGLTQFEKSLAELSRRMEGYFLDDEKFRDWGYAREYVLLYSSWFDKSYEKKDWGNKIPLNTISDYKLEMEYMHEFLLDIQEFSNTIGSLSIITEVELIVSKYSSLISAINNSNIIKNRIEIFTDAYWNKLTDEEREDLIFYTIMTLDPSKDNLTGFQQIYTYDLYEYAYNYVNGLYNKAKRENGHWYTFGVYKEMMNVNRIALNRINSVKNQANIQLNEWKNNFKEGLLSINNLYAAYSESRNKLEIMQGIKENGQYIEWNDIESALLNTNKFSENDIAGLKSYWASFRESNGSKHNNILDTLNSLVSWAFETEKNIKTALEKKWFDDSKTQEKNEIAFLTTVDEYIAGKKTLAELKTAAEKAYGKNSISWKNHFNNKYSALADNLSLYLNAKIDFKYEYMDRGNELIELTKKTLEDRYNAELSAREIEWSLTLNDLMEKYYEWQNSAAQILENGRTDWIDSSQKMTKAYEQWRVNFQNEYERVNAEWSEAYLAGLEDKERWLEQAANAANQASYESFLSLIGTEGERLSRAVDTREPFGIRNAAPQAQALMAELLQSSGIINMSGAFNSVNNIAGTVSVITRGGLSGGSAWDAALVKTTASDLAKKTNEEIADSQTRKLAFQVNSAAEEAVKGLAANVATANKNFRDGMDNYFILQGLWTKKDNNYVKEVVKGSTLFSPVISKAVTVAGFNDYTMEPVTLKTNLDENYLTSLNSAAIQQLLKNVFSELEVIAGEIFGIGEDAVEISEGREQSPGKFGAYIGYVPDVKNPDKIGEKRKDMFIDEGAGELGRLMSEFIYWGIVDSRGYGELTLAPWDKRIWNDEGSFFDAPSLRQLNDFQFAVAAAVVSIIAAPYSGGASIGVFIGAAAAIACISTTDELVFGALDAAFGYKTLDEAAFDWGKAVLTDFTTNIISGGFGGVGGVTAKAVGAVTDAFGKVVMQTLMTGLQTFTSTLATSVLSGITYNSQDKFGFNSDIFDAGMSNVGKNMLTSMAGAFTSSALTAINSGFDQSKLAGLN